MFLFCKSHERSYYSYIGLSHVFSFKKNLSLFTLKFDIMRFRLDQKIIANDECSEDMVLLAKLPATIV